MFFPRTAPVVVVIWSKYAQDKIGMDDVPPEDQETESQIFKRTLFEAEPRFKNRLVFLEMDKPKPDDRPEDWVQLLQSEIGKTLGQQSAIELLWTWDSIVKDSNAALMASLTDLAEESVKDTEPELTDAEMKEVLQRLAKAQSEGDLSPATAPGNLVAILSQRRPGWCLGLGSANCRQLRLGIFTWQMRHALALSPSLRHPFAIWSRL